MHSYCHDDNDLEEFWPSFFDTFFALWPEGQNIEERKHNIKGWFEAKRTTSTDWISYIPFELVLASFAAQEEQEVAIEKAKKGRKVQLRTWFRWRTNGSKKNRSLKKKSTVFDDALKPKRCTKSEAEIYLEMYYNERVKPLVMAEAEAGNVTTSGKRVALGRKFSKELLKDKTEDVKADIRSKYEEQLRAVKRAAKSGNHFLDLDDEVDDEMDAKIIMQGIDDLPVICKRFAQLVKQKTRFVVSFMFAGPDPRNNWDMTTLSCHPSETPQGKSFAEMYETADRDFLGAFQQYAERYSRKPDLSAMSEADHCEAKEGEEGEEGDEDEVDEHNVEESSSHQGEEAQSCRREGEGAGMGTLDAGAFFPNPLHDASAAQPGPALLGHASITPDASAAQSGPGLALNHASIAPDALMGAMDTSYDMVGHNHGLYTYDNHALYGMQSHLAYNTQPHLAYHSLAHLAYGTQYGTEAHLAYNMAAHDSLGTSQTDASFQAVIPQTHASFQPVIPQTNASFQAVIPPTHASLQSQGSSLQMQAAQTASYTGFEDITPTFSLTDASHDSQGTNWNFDGVGGVTNIPQGGWRLSDLLSPVSAECSSLTVESDNDSLPIISAPLPAEANKDLLPGAKGSSTGPTHGKPVPKPAKKCLRVNAKSVANQTEAAAAQSTPGDSKPSAATTKPSSNDTPMFEVIGPANVDKVDSAVRTKRVPIKSRRNELADAIGTDGVSFLAGKENTDLEASSASKRPALNDVPSAPKKKRAKA
ncbi:hypothetical protein BD769DRAFT_1663808 [Suillus cothurnatus]|nr:hypothetical protein BD769DRAFT_1663808 [Suillus cothurnatus]